MIPIYIGVPLAIVCGIAGGLAAGGMMKLFIRYFGSEGWGTETRQEKAIRYAKTYMERKYMERNSK